MNGKMKFILLALCVAIGLLIITTGSLQTKVQELEKDIEDLQLISNLQLEIDRHVLREFQTETLKVPCKVIWDTVYRTDTAVNIIWLEQKRYKEEK